MDFLISLITLSEYVFWFILVFTLIVFVHEFGHYFVARLNGVDVEKFSIGFGPVLYSKIDKKNTKWQFCIVPLGGYVKFSGEMYPNKNNKNFDDNEKLFMNKKALQKASIVFAGPLANFILSFFLFIIIFFFFGKNYYSPIVGNIDVKSPAERGGMLINDKILSLNKVEINNYEKVYSILDEYKADNIDIEVLRDNRIINFSIKLEKKIIKTFIGTEKEINYLGASPAINPVVGNVIKNSPAMIGGIITNDKILKINNVNIFDARKAIDIIKANPSRPVLITILRNNEILDLEVTPKKLIEKQIGQIGITFKKERKKIDFLNSIYMSINSIFEVSIKTLIAFYEILTNKRDHCEVGGPILIAKVSNDMANTDMISFVALVALISINLGLINLFPLPLLDGGHLFTYLSEFIIGKNINYNFFKIIQIVGIILIFSLMSFSILNDIYCRLLN